MAFNDDLTVVILAGGLGTRLSEETESRPKPMVNIDDKPIIWHIMKIYAIQGYRKFIIAGGYKWTVIKDWVDHFKFDWDIEVFDTGLESNTATSVMRCIDKIKSDKFMMTYGDGLANVHLSKLLDTHNRNSGLATVTAVRPPARFGLLHIDIESVDHFGEKEQVDAGWIN